jgi:hypothetical protein
MDPETSHLGIPPGRCRQAARPVPDAVDDLPDWARERVLEWGDARRRNDEEFAEYERLRDRRLAITGAVAALLLSPLLGNQSSWIPLVFLTFGAGAGRVIARRELDRLGASAVFGGGFMALSGLAHALGVLKLVDESMGSALQIRFLFVWTFACAFGGVMGSMQDAARSERRGS